MNNKTLGTNVLILRQYRGIGQFSTKIRAKEDITHEEEWSNTVFGVYFTLHPPNEQKLVHKSPELMEDGKK